MKACDPKGTKRSKTQRRCKGLMKTKRDHQNDAKGVHQTPLPGTVGHSCDRQAGAELSPGPSGLAQSPSQSCAAQPLLSAYQSIPVWLPGPPQLAGAVASDLLAACPREDKRQSLLAHSGAKLLPWLATVLRTKKEKLEQSQSFGLRGKCQNLNVCREKAASCCGPLIQKKC